MVRATGEGPTVSGDGIDAATEGLPRASTAAVGTELGADGAAARAVAEADLDARKAGSGHPQPSGWSYMRSGPAQALDHEVAVGDRGAAAGFVHRVVAAVPTYAQTGGVIGQAPDDFAPERR